jgi:hypothetical protein
MINDWQRSKTQVFWGEIAPCDHVVQIYENDEVFIDMLAGFVADGINADNSVIVIATGNHLNAVEARLWSLGLHVDKLIAGDQYIPLDAKETLSQFMVDGWPDEDRFVSVVSRLIVRARKNNRQVRAFGEMVAILWAQGHNGATVQLEHLWNRFCEKETFCLFCAYPKSGFTQDANDSLMHICGTHTKIITNSEVSLTEILYQDVVRQSA